MLRSVKNEMCVLALAGLIVCIGASASVASSTTVVSVTPSPTQLLTNSGLLSKPPRPPPPPPPPGDSGSDTRPPAPQVPARNQCVLGENVPTQANAVGLAKPDTLYVDTGTASQCDGFLVRWEICFNFRDTAMVTRVGALKLLILRVGSSRAGALYQVVSVSELDATPSDSEAAETTCIYRESEGEPLRVMEGDLIGFASGDDVTVALSSAAEREGRLFHYPLEPRHGLSGVSSLRVLRQSRLQQTSVTSGTPLIRAILSERTWC